MPKRRPVHVCNGERPNLTICVLIDVGGGALHIHNVKLGAKQLWINKAHCNFRACKELQKKHCFLTEMG